jgi:hypothetical protein
MINILRIHKLKTTEFIFFSKQNAMIVFADILFKSVFKSWRFEKHASKSYFKMISLWLISDHTQFFYLCFHLIYEASSVIIHCITRFSMFSPLSISTVADNGSKQTYINNKNCSDRKKRDFLINFIVLKH